VKKLLGVTGVGLRKKRNEAAKGRGNRCGRDKMFGTGSRGVTSPKAVHGQPEVVRNGEKEI